ncbi:MAG: CsgG/HfaB family protein [Pseudomonadota bacterium]|uniref:CsgG/HfaB family protein n=1 Tax=Alcanivorax sp. TaxID=1872427 RepID=UPI00243F19EF|nr:CsgG/HfaB family protein [Alcanivorax sp.]MED5239782.1 CsgG/HfaB family protein [Pseudomonadota bacterium]MEE3319792.1 CsgG/HfaB family protein [Pseudomonadota bacterium]
MYKRLFAPLIMALMLLSSFSHALTETVSVSSRGFGDTPEQAMTNALVAAVRQGGGVTLAVDPNFRTDVYEWVIQSQGDVSTWMGKETSVPEPQLPTLGNIKTYQVQSVKKVDDGMWQADVQAEILRPKSIGPDRSHLPGIAIATFDARASSYDLGDVKVSAQEVQRDLAENLSMAFTQSGRFRVLDRSYLADVEKELQTVSEGSVAPEEMARLGQRKGADLLLVGTIEDFQIGDSEREFYGAKMGGYEPYVRVRYRLIDTTTTEILWSDLYVWDKSEAEIREVARQLNIDDRNHPERLADVMYPEIARAIAGDATDVLYPVQVIKVDGDTVFLTQGEGRLEQDALMKVYRPAGEMKDPDTGMTIKMEGAALATLKVSEIRPDYGIAVVEGAASGPLKVGDRVRPDKQAQNRASQPAGQQASPGSSEAPIQW